MIPYRPFVGRPWQLGMGIGRLDPQDWIELGADAPAQLARRRELLDQRPGEVLGSLPGSAPGARELAGLLIAHLLARFPEHFRRTATGIRHAITGECLDPERFAEAPLALAGRLVPEDFCILLQAGDDPGDGHPGDGHIAGGQGDDGSEGGNSVGAGGHRLVAAVLCFPAHWRLADKLGHPLDLIHGPVPGFAERLAGPVERLFRSLQVARPVWRVNWSLVDTPELFLPERGPRRTIAAERAGDELWLRVERQTLRRLPVSGAVVFGIRTHVTRLADALDTPEAARDLAARVRELPEAMARYKGIQPIRAPLLADLDRRGAQGPRRAG